MEDCITPCRNLVDDRFPVVSFVVRVPEERSFEVACATDPRLFSPAWQGHRNEGNFFTTRGRGLAQAMGGETTVVLPAQQVARFAGNRKLYYVLGSYGGRDPGDVRFSVAPEAAEQVPFVSVAPDFTGRALESGGSAGLYGGREFGWGGDAVTSSPSSVSPASSSEYAGGNYGYVVDPATVVAQRRGVGDHPDEYGFAASRPAGVEAMSIEEPPGLEEPPGAGSGAGSRDEAGFAAVHPQSGAPAHHVPEETRYAAQYHYGGRSAASEAAHLEGSEPEGYEDPSQLLEANAVYGAPQASMPMPALPSAPGGGASGSHASAPPPQVSHAPSVSPSVPAPTPPSPPTHAPSAEALAPVVRAVVRNRGIEHYGHIGTDGHGGLQLGMGQFSQVGGALRRLIARAAQRDRAWYPGRESLFDGVFGPGRADALRAWAGGDADMVQVDGEHLTAPSWRDALRRSGRLHLAPPEGLGVQPHLDPFKAAQNEALVDEILLPAIPLARQLGLVTDRGAAMLLEVLLQHGPQAGRNWLVGLGGGGPVAILDIVQAAHREGHPNLARLRGLAERAQDLDDTPVVMGG